MTEELQVSALRRGGAISAGSTGIGGGKRSTARLITAQCPTTEACIGVGTVLSANTTRERGRK